MSLPKNRDDVAVENILQDVFLDDGFVGHDGVVKTRTHFCGQFEGYVEQLANIGVVIWAIRIVA